MVRIGRADRAQRTCGDFFKVSTLWVILLLILELFLFFASFALHEGHRGCLVSIVTGTDLVHKTLLVRLHLARRSVVRSISLCEVGIDLHLLQALADLLELRLLSTFAKGLLATCILFMSLELG